MRILVTGAKGFVGRNLCATLNNIRDGKDRTRPHLNIDEVFEYDIDTESSVPAAFPVGVSPVVSVPDGSAVGVSPEPSVPAAFSVGVSPVVSVPDGSAVGTPASPSPHPVLDHFCANCDFVFNLAGVNRPQNQEEFMQGNFGFASTLLDTLKAHGNRCPVMLSSSQQASLTGRFGNSEYGRSKKAGEDLFLAYERDFLQAQTDTAQPTPVPSRERVGAGRPRVLIYRFPNLFGKWCRPNYNSAVATFCNNIANDLPITVNDPSVELELLYIDDLVTEMLDALEGHEHRCEFNGLEVIPSAALGSVPSVAPQSQPPRYCYCPVTHRATLGHIVELLHQFADQPRTLLIPEIPDNSFAKKLYSTYLSYLPKEKVAFPLKMNVDDRGSFTELIHTLNCGQVSINISKPGITRGQHWHNTKWEFFIVVAGHGLIQQRKVGTDEVTEFEVSGDKIEAVHMLPGYTHNIINLSKTENLVTVMYANELFDPNHPDTFFEPV